VKKLDEIKKIIEKSKVEAAQKYKAEIIGIFGSYVRGEQKEESDIDILVRFGEDATLFDFVGLSLFLEEILGIKVDIVPQDTIRDEIREKIMNEVILV